MSTSIAPSLLDALRGAQRISVMTGAGISAESGVPTFRDAQGLWAQYRPEDLATPDAFQRDPKTVWEWYTWRREVLGEVAPNEGHKALATLEQRCPQFTLITQNVDQLHQRAGSRRVLELHGNLMRTICHRTGRAIDDALLRDASEIPPRSPHHPDGLARPDVVWFGEALPEAALNAAIEATACDVFFSIGTSSVVQPAASLALAAGHNGAVVIEINPAATPLTAHADFVVQGPAGEVLPAIVAAL